MVSRADTGLNQYSWAEHLIWMEGGEPPERRESDSLWYGLALATGIAVVGFGIGIVADRLDWSMASLFDPVLLAMILGIVVGNLIGEARWLPGLSFAVRRLLPLGIIFLGARMHLGTALEVGLAGILASIAVVVTSLLLMVWLGRLLGIDRELAFLLGIGTGICGGTAIVAIAPLISAQNRNVIVAVGLVTLVGLGSTFVLPVVAGILALTGQEFGILAGLTIHQTPQVIAAGFAYGEEAGEVATVTKLARVCLLAPIAILLSWWVMRKGGIESGGRARKPWYRLLPGFAIGFLLFALARSFGWLPEFGLRWSGASNHGGESAWLGSVEILKAASAWLLAMGMAGVGFQTRLSQAREVGLRPFLLLFTVTLFLTTMVIVLMKLFSEC